MIIQPALLDHQAVYLVYWLFNGQPAEIDIAVVGAPGSLIHAVRHPGISHVLSPVVRFAGKRAVSPGLSGLGAAGWEQLKDNGGLETYERNVK